MPGVLLEIELVEAFVVATFEVWPFLIFLADHF